MEKLAETFTKTGNLALDRWIQEMAELCQPMRIWICDGSDREYDTLAAELVKAGKMVPLDPLKRPRSFWCHSDPEDVARVEECTFICSQKNEDAGLTNHWVDPKEMKPKLLKLFSGCMKGRTMYVIPYCMGPFDSSFSIVGVEITDSAYVALNMKWMTRMGKEALKHLGKKSFVPGMHSVGVPLEKGQKDLPWPCNPKNRCIVHFPEERSIWSYGSGYGGNALLGKKCLALRIASAIGRDEGWLAEHMLILGLTNPKGEKKYIAAAFPSACGKTNLAMLTPTLPGWKVECVGDDIAWIRLGEDGGLWAVNPEAGYFGVAPGTSMETNPNAMRTIAKNTIFTNVALTIDGDVWWEGIGSPPPKGLTSWLGKPWKTSDGPAAHPNARFTVPASQNPIYDPSTNESKGVPLSAIIFGGRRNGVVPLIYEALSWQHGVFLGSSVSSEMTAAAKGEIGKLRHDPFAMLPFCGYHMGDYFAHWLSMSDRTDPKKLPRIYYVNWFQKDADGKFLWPGFGENSRVLKWIFERTSNSANGKKTPIGYLPEELDLSGLDLPASSLKALFSIDQAAWIKECEELEQYFSLFAPKMPQALLKELRELRARLG
ncbi:MAG: phosphoenolpyruvate carboxykinase (GTP) [Chlamydiae bacterium]|nr:phosphoenolpyruvate carboxykinase (GTP) [Chlamydiota bacterium]